jgi:hypothetical protein
VFRGKTFDKTFDKTFKMGEQLVDVQHVGLFVMQVEQVDLAAQQRQL